MVEHLRVFNHVGLLVNEPQGMAQLPFILSSDDFSQALTKPTPTCELVPPRLCSTHRGKSNWNLLSLLYPGAKERAGNKFPTSRGLWDGAVVPLRE